MPANRDIVSRFLQGSPAPVLRIAPTVTMCRMTHRPKGANAPVPTVTLRVAAGCLQAPGGPTVEAAALLLDATGSVRGDADIVFHGRPSHPSGGVRHLGTGRTTGSSPSGWSWTCRGSNRPSSGWSPPSATTCPTTTAVPRSAR
ncbi:TerD family protein [Streptomyces sp. NPDC046203]|uniref:TerD family protein n=1 Tax=Streptomyces sp. NPDC046203 TaxID=3154602 RepID=UPI0033E1CB58